MGRPALTNNEVEDFRRIAADTTLDLYAEGGIAAMTFRKVAAALDMTTGGLYRYFPDGRDELLATIRIRGLQRIRPVLDTSAGQGASAVSKLVSGADAFVAWTLENPREFKLLFINIEGEWDRFDGLQVAIDRIWKVVEALFVQAIDEGALQGDPKILARTLYAAVVGAMSIHFSGEDDPLLAPEALIKPLVEQLIRGARS